MCVCVYRYFFIFVPFPFFRGSAEPLIPSEPILAPLRPKCYFSLY